MKFGSGKLSHLRKCTDGKEIFFSCPVWLPIIAAARSKAWTVFARSNAGIVGSNPTEGMDVCVRVYSVFVLSSV
jgi:hypothetical protein